MTARELFDALAALGVVVQCRDGQPALNPPGGKWTPEARRRVEELAPELATHRSTLLEAVGFNLWEPGWAIRRMSDADSAVERCGGRGMDGEIQAAANKVIESYTALDRKSVEEWCCVIEARARELHQTDGARGSWSNRRMVYDRRKAA